VRGNRGNRKGSRRTPPPKVTLCHATHSETNPYVEITISERALNAHRAHQDGEDIVPAPAGGCPGSSGKARNPESSGHRNGLGAALRSLRSAPRAGKQHRRVTICHATGSATNPYVEITIPETAVRAHQRHQDGRDVVPAPEGGCPAAVGSETPPPASGGLPVTGEPPATSEPPPAEPTTPSGTLGEQGEGGTPSGGAAGERAQGGDPPSGEPAGRVAGASASGGSKDNLPFTGLELLALLALGTATLLSGVGIRKAIGRS
jgi:hypothetical protein